MYKHLLVPIDGSRLSTKAVKEAATLAKLCGARITLFTAVADYPSPVFIEAALLSAYVSPDEYKKEAAKSADKILAKAAEKVVAAGVRVDTLQVVSDSPFDAIIKAATKQKSDLIVMASHGRGGLAGFVLGSETQKVLSHATLPVLVVR